MVKKSFGMRVALPLTLVLGLMIISTNLYDYSRYLEHRAILANLSALGMFVSIWLGALIANSLAYFLGASFTERLFVSLVTPLVWSAKTLYSFFGIYSWGEIFFLIFHNIILGCPVVALLCAGVSEVCCRAVDRRGNKDSNVKILTRASLIPLLLGLSLTFIMLWNGGHSYYYKYMDIYSSLFLQEKPKENSHEF